MNSELLMDALNYLNEDMLNQAALLRMKPARKHSAKRFYVLYGSLAAAVCLCLMLTASFVLNRNDSRDFSGDLLESLKNGESPKDGNHFVNSADSVGIESNSQVTLTVSFDAVILELRDGFLTVEPVEGSELHSRYDKIMVSTDGISADELLGLTSGKTVRIVYDGTISDSEPPQVNAIAVYDIESTGSPE